MTQIEMILEFFKRHDGVATLGELLEDGRFSYAHKLTARMSDLRKIGYHITCVKGRTPGHNKYILTHPMPEIPTISYDETGQASFC